MIWSRPLSWWSNAFGRVSMVLQGGKGISFTRTWYQSRYYILKMITRPYRTQKVMRNKYNSTTRDEMRKLMVGGGILERKVNQLTFKKTFKWTLSLRGR